MNLPRPPRRHPRRSPGVHRPLRPAPDTPAEVLDRAPDDVSRETSSGPMAPYVAGGLLPDPDPAPPLRKDQVAKLEALTAVWTRDVRVGGPGPDDTVLYSAPSQKPPPPPARPRAEVVEDPPPVPDAAEVAERSAELRADDAPVPAPSRAPGMDPGSAPARVSDWVSRHDPRSLAYGVRQRLGVTAPLREVSLSAGPVLDQGTTPPLSLIDASACVGMALTTAANVLELHRDNPRSGGIRDEWNARELYHAAQRFDHVHGEDYAGTSVLGGLLAGREAGLWNTFLWALNGTRDIAQVLVQLGVAVVVGVPWDSSLENPDADGVITPGGASLGGHALAVVGLRSMRGTWYFELQQSRGRAEGKAGRVFIHHRHLAQLLAGIGEAGVPLPEDLS